MDPLYIQAELFRNKFVFLELLEGTAASLQTWRPAPEKWCLLEILCHLYDEERDDFRYRTQHVLSTPTLAMPGIDPVAWVEARAYLGQNFEEMLEKFLSEREASLNWLSQLEAPQWDNIYIHPELGAMSAGLFLANWLAHDYIHIRQILKVKYAYAEQSMGLHLDYAGNW